MWRPLVALRGRKNRRANVPERDGLYGLVPVITTPKQAIAMLWHLWGNIRRWEFLSLLLSQTRGPRTL